MCIRDSILTVDRSPELRALLERVRSGDRAETGIERMGLELSLIHI